MFKHSVGGYSWHPGSLGQTVEKAMNMFKKDFPRAHLLLPSSSPVPLGRCSSVVVGSSTEDALAMCNQTFRSGLIAGGRDSKGGRQTIFFTPLNLFGDNPDEEEPQR